MQNFIGFIKGTLVGAGLIIGSWLGVTSHTDLVQPVSYTTAPQVQDLGAYNVTGGGTYRLKSSVGVSDTTIQLASFKEPVSNIPLSMSQLASDIEYGTIDPQTSRSEFVSFTGITQNSDGSASLTGVSRGLPRSPAGIACTASSTLALRHPGQAAFILSNSPCQLAEYPAKRNDETITGDWHVPTPTNGSSIANKDFVTGLVNGGTVSVDRNVVAATAGENFSAGSVVFFDRYQAKWFRTDADVSSTTENILVGIAQGAGSTGVSISGGVLTRGLDTTTQINMTPGSPIYVSGTTGATSTSAGTFPRQIGIARTSTSLYVDQKIDYNAFGNATTTNLYISGNTNIATTTNPIFGNYFINDIGKFMQVCTANCTWTRPSGVTRIRITLVGGGGGGGSDTGSNAASGGGGGSTCIRSIDVTGTSTVNAIVGSGGATASAGATSTFSTYCEAGGGGPGATGAGDGGYAGSSIGGDLNLRGGRGGDGVSSGSTQSLSGPGGGTSMGFGIAGVHSSVDASQLNNTCGYGGGGAGSNSHSGTGAAGCKGVLIIQW